MVEKKRNIWFVKIKRIFTSILPVAKNRVGKCIDCGACCQLPNVCPFLKFKSNGKSYCSVYPIRPLSCRKYPRTEFEHVTQDTCGFKFR